MLDKTRGAVDLFTLQHVSAVSGLWRDVCGQRYFSGRGVAGVVSTCSAEQVAGGALGAGDEGQRPAHRLPLMAAMQNVVHDLRQVAPRLQAHTRVLSQETVKVDHSGAALLTCS